MKDLHFMRLWDWYQGLLTDNQREITNLYFNCDLSLAEIAEEKGCSRQSVSDCLNKCRKQLEEYESKLHFVRTVAEAEMENSCRLTDLARWGEGLPEDKRKELSALLEKDYSGEAERLVRENPDSLC